MTQSNIKGHTFSFDTERREKKTLQSMTNKNFSTKVLAGGGDKNEKIYVSIFSIFVESFV